MEEHGNSDIQRYMVGKVGSSQVKTVGIVTRDGL